MTTDDHTGDVASTPDNQPTRSAVSNSLVYKESYVWPAISAPEQLAAAYEALAPGSPFFSRETMQYWGDTMENYEVHRVILRVIREPGESAQGTFDTPAFGLYRKQPVKHGLQQPAFFYADSLRRVKRLIQDVMFPDSPPASLSRELAGALVDDDLAEGAQEARVQEMSGEEPRPLDDDDEYRQQLAGKIEARLTKHRAGGPGIPLSARDVVHLAAQALDMSGRSFLDEVIAQLKPLPAMSDKELSGWLVIAIENAEKKAFAAGFDVINAPDGPGQLVGTVIPDRDQPEEPTGEPDVILSTGDWREFAVEDFFTDPDQVGEASYRALFEHLKEVETSKRDHDGEDYTPDDALGELEALQDHLTTMVAELRWRDDMGMVVPQPPYNFGSANPIDLREDGWESVALVEDRNDGIFDGRQHCRWIWKHGQSAGLYVEGWGESYIEALDDVRQRLVDKILAQEARNPALAAGYPGSPEPKNAARGDTWKTAPGDLVLVLPDEHWTDACTGDKKPFIAKVLEDNGVTAPYLQVYPEGLRFNCEVTYLAKAGDTVIGNSDLTRGADFRGELESAVEMQDGVLWWMVTNAANESLMFLPDQLALPE